MFTTRDYIDGFNPDRENLWGVRFLDAPEPFNQWIPAVDCTINLWTINNLEQSVGNTTVKFPQATSNFTFSVSFYDDERLILTDWHSQWVNSNILGIPGCVRPLSAVNRQLEVRKYDRQGNTVYIWRVLVIPEGNYDFSGNTASNDANTLSLDYQIVGSYGDTGPVNNGGGVIPRRFADNGQIGEAPSLSDDVIPTSVGENFDATTNLSEPESSFFSNIFNAQLASELIDLAAGTNNNNQVAGALRQLSAGIAGGNFEDGVSVEELTNLASGGATNDWRQFADGIVRDQLNIPAGGGLTSRDIARLASRTHNSDAGVNFAKILGTRIYDEVSSTLSAFIP